MHGRHNVFIITCTIIMQISEAKHQDDLNTLNQEEYAVDLLTSAGVNDRLTVCVR